MHKSLPILLSGILAASCLKTDSNEEPAPVVEQPSNKNDKIPVAIDSFHETVNLARERFRNDLTYVEYDALFFQGYGHFQQLTHTPENIREHYSTFIDLVDYTVRPGEWNGNCAERYPVEKTISNIIIQEHARYKKAQEGSDNSDYDTLENFGSLKSRFAKRISFCEEELFPEIKKQRKLKEKINWELFGLTVGGVAATVLSDCDKKNQKAIQFHYEFTHLLLHPQTSPYFNHLFNTEYLDKDKDSLTDITRNDLQNAVSAVTKDDKSLRRLSTFYQRASQECAAKLKKK